MYQWAGLSRTPVSICLGLFVLHLTKLKSDMKLSTNLVLPAALRCLPFLSILLCWYMSVRGDRVGCRSAMRDVTDRSPMIGQREVGGAIGDR